MPELVASPSLPREYIHFIPRRAARGRIAIAAPVNFPTFLLFNTSTAAQLLIVWQVSNDVNTPFLWLAYQQGAAGFAQGGVVRAVQPDSAPPPGALYFADSAALASPDYGILGSGGATLWLVPYPFAILPPNWGLVVQGRTAAQALGISFLWHWLYPEEYDRWSAGG